MTTFVARQQEATTTLIMYSKRAKGFEPSTSTLATLRSTTELRPRYVYIVMIMTKLPCLRQDSNLK